MTKRSFAAFLKKGFVLLPLLFCSSSLEASSRSKSIFVGITRIKNESQIIPRNNKADFARSNKHYKAKNLWPYQSFKNPPFLLKSGYKNYKSKASYSAFCFPGIATGLILSSALQKDVEAKGRRGDGYRPYDCSWGPQFAYQASEALENAKYFKELCGKDILKGEDLRKVGVSVLVELLFAHDQSKYIFRRHNINYFCWGARGWCCQQYDENLRLHDRYDFDLRWEIDHIRDKLGVPQPVGWERQVASFLQGGANAGAMIVSVSAVLNSIPGGQIVGLGLGVGILTFKTVEGVAKHLFDDPYLLHQEEIAIRQELFVRALCADKHSIQQAQAWGGWVVTSALIVGGVFDGLKTLRAARAAEAVEALETMEVVEIATETTEALEILKTAEVIEVALETVEGMEALEAVEILEAPNFATKNYKTKVGKHIHQVRQQYPKYQGERIPKPKRGGYEVVEQIVRDRLAKGGKGVVGKYWGEPAIFFRDGAVTYVFRPNGDFWTFLSNLR